jgi:hypothetical protein
MLGASVTGGAFWTNHSGRSLNAFPHRREVNSREVLPDPVVLPEQRVYRLRLNELREVVVVNSRAGDRSGDAGRDP